MSNSSGGKPTFQQRLDRTFRSLTLAYLLLMPPAFAAIAFMCRKQAPYNQVPFPLLIFLALLFGASLALLLGYGGARFAGWLYPEPDQRKMRVALLALFILATLINWASWKDEPTDAQIIAIHHDPRFAAAIDEMKEKHMNSFFLMHAMEREGSSQVSRYTLFAIDTGATFIVFGFLFLTYRILFRILCSIFRIKDPVADPFSK
jgi:hypothetical protein